MTDLATHCELEHHTSKLPEQGNSQDDRLSSFSKPTAKDARAESQITFQQTIAPDTSMGRTYLVVSAQQTGIVEGICSARGESDTIQASRNLGSTDDTLVSWLDTSEFSSGVPLSTWTDNSTASFQT
jgi:hypothetical protein